MSRTRTLKGIKDHIKDPKPTSAVASRNNQLCLSS
jgi:hypothetical protein